MKNKRELAELYSTDPIGPPVKKSKVSQVPDKNETYFESGNVSKDFIHLYAIHNNLNYGKIKNKITNMLYKRKFAELEQYLSGVPNEIKNEVFQRKFYYLIKYIFCMKSKLDIFQFILKHISADVLKSLFKQEEYGIFKNFLLVEKTAEIFENDTEEERQYRIDKFIFVIKTIGIEAARQVIDYESVSEKITEDFNKACQEYNSQMQHNCLTTCL